MVIHWVTQLDGHLVNVIFCSYILLQEESLAAVTATKLNLFA